METILLKDNQITQSTVLGGNIDVDKYKYCIIDAQLSRLEELLGEDLYEKIRVDFENDDLSDDYLILHTKYITPFLVHQSAMHYLKVGAYQVTNGGIYKHTPANGTPIEKTEVDFMVQEQRSMAEMYAQRMEKWLCKTRLTEYKYESDNIVNPTQSKSGGFYYG